MTFLNEQRGGTALRDQGAGIIMGVGEGVRSFV